MTRFPNYTTGIFEAYSRLGTTLKKPSCTVCGWRLDGKRRPGTRREIRKPKAPKLFCSQECQEKRRAGAAERVAAFEAKQV